MRATRPSSPRTSPSTECSGKRWPAKPANDLGFAEFEFDRVSQIAAAAKSAGFGFGEQGTAAGRFYDLPPLPMAPPVPISSNQPR